MTSTTRAQRDERRAAGALVPCGKCHFCGYKVPPKAHWCSGECAKDYAAETVTIEQATKEGGQ